ncbi:MAG: hypothetical protein D6785_06010, partial [Planctomycetota bacterium]
KYTCTFTFLFFLTSCVTSSQGKNQKSFSSAKGQKKNKILIEYYPKKDYIRILVKKDSFLKMIQGLAKYLKIEIHYEPKDLDKIVTLKIPPKPVIKALEEACEKAGFQMKRAKVGIGFVIQPRHMVPALGKGEISQKISVALSKEEIGELLFLNDPKYFQPLAGANRERALTADIYYAYRPIFQELLWKKIPLISQKNYHLPYQIKKLEEIRTYYSAKKQEILTEVLFSLSLTHRIHIVFQFSFETLHLKKITIFVTAIQIPK